MNRFIKLIMSVLLSLLIIVISIISAFAVVSDVQPATSSSQVWQNSYFKSILNYNKTTLSKYDTYDTFINNLEKAYNDNVRSFAVYNKTNKKFYISFFDRDNVDFVLNIKGDHNNWYATVIPKVTGSTQKTMLVNPDSKKMLSNVYSWGDININSVICRYCYIDFDLSVDDCILISDGTLNMPSELSGLFSECYYSSNIATQFREWLLSEGDDDVDYDVLKPLRGNSIKYYDCLNHSNLYSSGLDKYICSSADFSTNVYYSKDHLDDIAVNGDVNYDQKQEIRIYILLDEEVQRKIRGYFIQHKINGDTDTSFINDPDVLSSIYENVDTLGGFYYYNVQGSINFQTWINTFCFSDERIKVYNNKYYYTFCMPDYYTLLKKPNNDVFLSGYKTVVNLPKADFADSPSNVGGVGSRLDDATNGIPSKSDLIGQGFKNGYPNNKGSFPYCITISQNGEVYQKWYFKDKPKLNSWYYSDKCIRYTADVSTSIGYVYIPSRNVSYEFDFKELNGVTGDTINKIIDGVGAGLSVTAIATGENIPLAVVSVVVDLISLYDFSGFDIGTIKDKTFDFWTNYSGTSDNYIGYIVTFNWSLENGALIKNNSDDNYDYSQAYKNDKPITEQATDSNGTLITGNNYYYTYNYYYSDNNGNVHGGGDETYIPTEPPTASNIVSYDYGSYNFTSDLANNSAGFFDFIRSALSFMPWWVYASVGASIAVMIALRILGR